jgi:hypothetical protein
MRYAAFAVAAVFVTLLGKALAEGKTAPKYHALTRPGRAAVTHSRRSY